MKEGINIFVTAFGRELEAKVFITKWPKIYAEILETINSHIVPETYLKHFADGSNLLWRNKIKSHFPSKIRAVSPAQICYQPNYFRLISQRLLEIFRTTDKDFIEKEVFKGMENAYNDILEKIKSKNQFLSMNDATLFIDVLINIKARNEKMRKKYSKENLKPIYEKKLNALKVEWPSSKLLHKMQFEEFEKLVKREVVEREGIEEEIFLSSFADEKNGVLREIKENLLKMKWNFFTTDLNSVFITSDNPGYCVDNNDRQANTNFSGKYMFIFPLSPQVCLMICNVIQDMDQIDRKNIYFNKVSANIVHMINQYTRRNCNTQIFSNKKEALNN